MTPRQHIRARHVSQTDAAWCLGQPDVDGGLLWWLPKSEVAVVERYESVTQTVVVLAAPVWLIAEKRCGVLLHDPAGASGQTMTLPGF